MVQDSEHPSSGSLAAKVAVAGVFLLLIIAGIFVWAVCSQYGVRYSLDSDLKKGIKVAEEDMQLGKRQINQMFAQAIKDKTDPEVLMELYRKYACFLYGESMFNDGDTQIQNAIDLGTKDNAWTKYQAVGRELSQAYYERAWYVHKRWLKGKKGESAEQDQLKAVEVAKKSLGDADPETIQRVSFLALIYTDQGNFAKSDEVMKNCLASVGDSQISKAANWFAYAMLARMKAVQHKYPEAIEAFLNVKDVATEEHVHRAWDELLTGLRADIPKDKATEKPETTLAKKLFANEDFAELDRVCAHYWKNPTIYWTGFESGDYLTAAIEGNWHIKGDKYKNWVTRFEKWLKKNPKSDMARTCLAQLHIYRAWAVEDDDNDNTIYKSLIAKAEKVMEADPTLPDRFPKAYIPALRLAAAKHEREPLEKVIEALNKRWPRYICADTWAFKFQDYETLGEDIDRIAYVEKRADSFGGNEGDKYYARIACEFQDDLHKPEFSKRTRFDWKRIRKGMDQIVKEFPDEIEARISYLNMADDEDDKEAMMKAFDGFAPQKKAP